DLSLQVEVAEIVVSGAGGLHPVAGEHEVTLDVRVDGGRNDGNEVLEDAQRGLSSKVESRPFRIDLDVPEQDLLQEGPRLARRPQPQDLHLGDDVPLRDRVPSLAGPATLEQIVGEE